MISTSGKRSFALLMLRLHFTFRWCCNFYAIGM
jgi:hypothetical protein